MPTNFITPQYCTSNGQIPYESLPPGDTLTLGHEINPASLHSYTTVNGNPITNLKHLNQHENVDRAPLAKLSILETPTLSNINNIINSLEILLTKGINMRDKYVAYKSLNYSPALADRDHPKDNDSITPTTTTCKKERKSHLNRTPNTNSTNQRSTCSISRKIPSLITNIASSDGQGSSTIYNLRLHNGTLRSGDRTRLRQRCFQT